MDSVGILKKAIEKARSNGFIMDNHRHFCEIGRDVLTGSIETLGAYESIIFDHNFAKAFWGEKPCVLYKNILADSPICSDEMPIWKYHIQEMSLEINRIGYLGKFI
jgi:hypothetical protein